MPPSLAHVLVDVEGRGTIVSVGGAARPQIRCGVAGTACAAEVAPGGKVSVRAKPGRGYRLARWTEGCRGKRRICTVSMRKGKVGAKFVARKGRPVAIHVGNPHINATFERSVGRGTLMVKGAVGASARLQVQLRGPGGRLILTRKMRVRRGRFALKALLARGKLAHGANLFPGSFIIGVEGRAGKRAVPRQLRTVFVKAPRVGVVRRSYPSTSWNGKAVTSLPAGVTQAWVIFRFQMQPTAGPVTVSWYEPSGTLIGTRRKSNRPTIETGIGSEKAIPSGTWRVDLRVGGKLVKRQKVRIG